jgi:hypothetical protein
LQCYQGGISDIILQKHNIKNQSAGKGVLQPCYFNEVSQISYFWPPGEKSLPSINSACLLASPNRSTIKWNLAAIILLRFYNACGAQIDRLNQAGINAFKDGRRNRLDQ